MTRLFLIIILILTILLPNQVNASSGGPGANYAGLLTDFIDSSRRADAIEAIQSASLNNVGFLRYSALGFSKTVIQTYVDNETGFWSVYDDMVDQCNKYNVKLVPCFMWNLHQIPEYLSTTDNQTVFIPDSTANTLLKTIVLAIVDRYKNNPAILFWEIGNEINIITDLEIGGVYDPVYGCNLTTSQMITFMADMATEIKSADGVHEISSGNQMPRPMAYHLQTGSWTTDNRTEFEYMILATNPDPINIVSVHAYNLDTYSFGYGDNERPSWTPAISGHYNADLLNIVKSKTDSVNKRLFIGEYADQNPYIQGALCSLSENKSAPFSVNVLSKADSLKIPYTAVWEWYAPSSCSRVIYRIAPGETDYFINKLMEY